MEPTIPQLPEAPEIPLPKPDPDILEKIAEWISTLEMPSHEQIVNYVAALGWLESVMLVICGVVYLIYGWKTVKVLVAVNAAFVGVLLGCQLGTVLKGQHMPLIGAVAGAILFGALAWPLLKYAVSLMGGLAGSFLGYGLWHYATAVMDKPHLNEHAWVGALIGLLTLGLLAFIVFRLTVVTFTCIQGAVMVVAGLLSLTMKYEPFRVDLHNSLVANKHLLPLLVIVPAVIGFAIQYAKATKKSAKAKS